MKPKNIQKIAFGSLIVCVIFAVIPLIWLTLFNNQTLSKNIIDWGAYGSYVSGLLSPLIALLVLFYIKASYDLQASELNSMRNLVGGQLEESKNQTVIAAHSAILTSVSSQILEAQVDRRDFDESREYYKKLDEVDSVEKLTEIIDENIEKVNTLRAARRNMQDDLGKLIIDYGYARKKKS